MTIYRLRATALCPNDGSRDHYDVELRSTSVRIDVEELRAFFEDYANRSVYQERLAEDAAGVFQCEVSITGQHPSPVEIVT